jgi:hypothetical protein
MTRSTRAIQVPEESALKQRPVWFGIVLIVIGVALLLDHIHFLTMSWWFVFWASLVVGSVVLLVRNSRRKEGGIFWLTVLFFFALYKTLQHLGALDIQESIGFPLLLIVAGIGIGVIVAIHPARWHLLIPSLTLIGIGAAILLAEYGVVSEWSVKDLLRTYWPVAVILYGGALLANSGWWKGREKQGL